MGLGPKNNNLYKLKIFNCKFRNIFMYRFSQLAVNSCRSL
jgi:hypothetical protein